MGASEVLGLDVGLKQTGIARASSIAKISEPLETVRTSALVPKLKQISSQMDVSAIVVGLPRNLQGNDTAQTALVRQWVKEAKSEIKAPFYWQDESLTSIEASKAEKLELVKPSDEHSIAAAIILQDFLDSPPSQRKLA